MLDGWVIDKPHKMESGEGGNRAGYSCYWRVFVFHAETKSNIIVTGASKMECLKNVKAACADYVQRHGLDLPLPEGWDLEFSEQSAGGKLCMMLAFNEGDQVSAIGVSIVDARMRLIEEINAGNTFAARRARLS